VADGAGRYRRTQLGVDDVLDALVLAVTGWLGADGLDRVPSMPEFDDIGLPMEIVFAHPYDGEAPIWPTASEIDA
jgi:predicted RNase H-like nuclease